MKPQESALLTLASHGDPGYGVLEVGAPLSIAAHDIRHELRNLDLPNLRLTDTFDREVRKAEAS